MMTIQVEIKMDGMMTKPGITGMETEREMGKERFDETADLSTQAAIQNKPISSRSLRPSSQIGKKKKPKLHPRPNTSRITL